MFTEYSVLVTGEETVNRANSSAISDAYRATNAEAARYADHLRSLARTLGDYERTLQDRVAQYNAQLKDTAATTTAERRSALSARIDILQVVLLRRVGNDIRSTNEMIDRLDAVAELNRSSAAEYDMIEPGSSSLREPSPLKDEMEPAVAPIGPLFAKSRRSTRSVLESLVDALGSRADSSRTFEWFAGEASTRTPDKAFRSALLAHLATGEFATALQAPTSAPRGYPRALEELRVLSKRYARSSSEVLNEFTKLVHDITTATPEGANIANSAQRTGLKRLYMILIAMK